MKTTTQAFNPILDHDVIAYRMVQQFKRCIEKDEWFAKSTEDEKIIIFINDSDVYESMPIAVNALRSAGYNIEAKATYWGGPIPLAISYYPNKKIETI